MVERALSTSNTGGWDRYILTDDAFPAGCAIQDLALYVELSGAFNIKYTLRVEGAVREDTWLVGSSPIANIVAAGYQSAVASNRADFAVQTRVVLEVQVASGVTGPSGSGVFTVSLAPRLFT